MSIVQVVGEVHVSVTMLVWLLARACETVVAAQLELVQDCRYGSIVSRLSFVPYIPSSTIVAGQIVQIVAASYAVAFWKDSTTDSLTYSQLWFSKVGTL